MLVCLDETSKQLVGETRQPRPPRPGSPLTYDYAYQRNGVSNLFMLYAPLEGWRWVSVTERHTRRNWAEVVRQLVDEDFPHKERIVLVLDNLNTHHPASLYEAFEPAEAQRIAQRLEIHYTPKHGSWLNPVLSRSKGWPRANWGCWPGSAWTAGYPVGKSWNGKPMPGSNGATRRASGQTGASLPRTPASSLSPYTHHFNSDRLLVPRPAIFDK